MENPILSMMQATSSPGSSTNPILDMISPDDVNAAKTHTGERNFDNLCEAFVEKMTGAPRFGSAIAAWNNYAQNGQGVSGVEGVKPGDLIYFSPNAGNQEYGHTGIYAGGNQFTSATETGVQTKDMSDWQRETGQVVLGYVPQEKIKPNPILSLMKGAN